MVSEVVTPGSMPESSSAVAGSCSSKPFTNKSISIQLDESNYLLWRQQRSITKPEFVVYKQEDSALCSWLLSSISGTILPSLVNCRTAVEIWDKVQQNFSVFSTTKIMHLHCSLKNIRKRDQTMRDYLAQIQSICDNLAACGNPLTETMHISTILSGLPSEYESVVAVITSSQQLYKLDGVCSVLLDTEARQQEFETHYIPVNFAQGSFGNGFSHNPCSFLGPSSNTWNEFGSTGFVGQVSSNVTGPGGFSNGPQPYVGQPRFSQDSFSRANRPNLSNPANSYGFQGGRSNFYRGRGGRAYGGRSHPQCQLCGRVGHLINRCYYRFDQSYDGFYSGNFVEETVDVQGSETDSGMTQDLSGTVALVSGDFLPVVSIVLNNLLHIPSVKKNLLSVSKFTKDNNVSVEFFPNPCVVKDLQTQQVMLQGVENNGLYKLSSLLLQSSDSGSCNSKCHNVVENNNVCLSVSSILSNCNSDSAFENVAYLSELELWHRRVGHPSDPTLDGQSVLAGGFQKDAECVPPAKFMLPKLWNASTRVEPSANVPASNVLQHNSLPLVYAEPEIPTQCSLPSVEAEVSAQPNLVTHFSSQPATLSSERVLQSATPDFVSVSPSVRVPIVYKCKSKFMITQQQPELDNFVLLPQSHVLSSAQNQESDFQPDQNLPYAQSQGSILRSDQNLDQIQSSSDISAHEEGQSDRNSDQGQDSSDMSTQEEGVSPALINTSSSSSAGS
ncbi:hypothetical protein GQ457_06G008700 [Hibiscus cannabinus]